MSRRGLRHAAAVAAAARAAANGVPVTISQVLKRGQDIIVQVAKEPMGPRARG